MTTPNSWIGSTSAARRMLGVLERLHARAGPRLPRSGSEWTIPAFRGERLAVEGCRTHDILISSREGTRR